MADISKRRVRSSQKTTFDWLQGLEDVEFEIVRVGDRSVIEGRVEIQKNDYSHRARKNQSLSEIEMRDLNLKVMAEYVLIGWKGLTDEGKEYPYTFKNAFNLLENDPELLDTISKFCLDNSNFLDSKAAETAKKSGKS